MKYDIIIIGAGAAGLWLLNTLKQKGFSVLLIEKESIGGTQTLASQGMIHGGQRYLLEGVVTAHARSVAKMPERWQAALEGNGDIDLREVIRLSDTQVMWPAGSFFSEAGLTAASMLVNTKTKKLAQAEFPHALTAAGVRNAHELPEHVLDMKSLTKVLSEPHRESIVQGEITALTERGEMTVSGIELAASLIIFAAGQGNAEALRMLGAPEDASQERPLRQLQVKTLEHPLFGHGVVNNPRPRITITSHPIKDGYVWYLGGKLASDVVLLTDAEAIAYAKQEMAELFPNIDWNAKEWATWYGVRAEARAEDSMLGDQPVVQEYGNVAVAWPTKLTLVPALADRVHDLIDKRGLIPKEESPAPDLPCPPFGSYPWERGEESR